MNRLPSVSRLSSRLAPGAAGVEGLDVGEVGEAESAVENRRISAASLTEVESKRPGGEDIEVAIFIEAFDHIIQDGNAAA